MPELDNVLAGGPLLGLLLLASVLVGLSKGGLPGVGMLSVPLLALMISPVAAAVLLLPIFILSDIVGVWLYRREYSAENLKVLIPAGVAGVLLGWSTASIISDQMVSLMIGLLGIGFCLYRWFGRNVSIAPTCAMPAKGWFWGTLSGFTSFVSHAGGPPYQIYILPQQLPKMIFAGTTTILFALVNLAKVIPYAYLHPYSKDTLQLSLLLLPFAAVGTMLGRWLIQHLSEKWFYSLVQIALFLISVRLVYSVLFT